MSGASLGDEVRVGDLATDDRHHVGVAGSEHGLGTGRRADVTLGLHDGVADDRLERSRRRLTQPGGVERRRHQRVEVEVAAGPARHVVHQCALVVPGDDLLQFGLRQGTVGIGVEVDGQADDEVVAARLPDPVEEGGREAHPVFEGAAPAVGAPVRPRSPELVDERVVGGEHFDAVEAALPCPRCRPDERPDDLLDLRLGHRMAAVGVVHRRQARWRPVLAERVGGVAVLADVVQLLDHDHAAIGGCRFVAGVGEPPEMRHHGVVVGQEVASREHRRGVHRNRLDDDHPRSAERPLPVVRDVTFRRQPALAHVGGVGAEVDPAPQRPVAERQRREHVREVVHQAI